MKPLTALLISVDSHIRFPCSPTARSHADLTLIQHPDSSPTALDTRAQLPRQESGCPGLPLESMGTDRLLEQVIHGPHQRSESLLPWSGSLAPMITEATQGKWVHAVGGQPGGMYPDLF